MAKYENMKYYLNPTTKYYCNQLIGPNKSVTFVGNQELDVDAMGRVVDAEMKRENVNSLNNPPQLKPLKFNLSTC